MMSLRQFVGFVVICVLVGLTCSCNDRICAAYQSTYILDAAEQHKFFSLFGEDTLPKEEIDVNKNKYGIMAKVSYRRRVNQLAIIEMVNVLPTPIDSISLDSLQLYDGDTILGESVAEEAMVTNDHGANDLYSGHYNVDQAFYMYKFGDILLAQIEAVHAPKKEELSDEDIANQLTEQDSLGLDSLDTGSKKKRKKKKKKRKNKNKLNDADSLSSDSLDEEDFSLDEQDSEQELTKAEKKEQKRKEKERKKAEKAQRKKEKAAQKKQQKPNKEPKEEDPIEIESEDELDD